MRFRLGLRAREPSPAERRTSVDLRRDCLFVVARVRTAAGIWYVGDWLDKMRADAPDEQLGSAVETALEHSVEVAGRKDDWLDALLKAAGVQSWSRYAKGLRSVSILRVGEAVTVTPKRNLGAREGFEEMVDAEERLASPATAELGAAVKRALAKIGAADAPAVSGSGGDAVSFGRKTAWLAVRNDDPEAVARALGLEDRRAEDWSRAIDEVEQGESRASVFVTPAVDGWTLVVLSPLLADGDVFDLMTISRAFGEAQKFASHRVSDYYEWQRWMDGEPVRRYAWIGDEGEIPFDDGEPAAAETGLLRKADLNGDSDDKRLADEDVVLAVAREWSVDPMTLGDRSVSRRGLIGYADASIAAGRRVSG